MLPLTLENLSFLVGLPLGEAEQQLDEQFENAIARIVVEDGRPKLGTTEFNPNRVNLRIRDGIVTEVVGLG